ncbi:hypothetical protein [Paenibacillus sp. 276b]|uniref:hypothetical protein n=1 Tax=Paenibacillus sp. 276b TaxID=1566277 RepID=UPI000B897B0D|nr:hypothetical protein [Paenibacillus sp. 276b]
MLKFFKKFLTKKHEKEAAHIETFSSKHEVADIPTEIQSNSILAKIVYLKNNRVVGLPNTYYGAQGVVHLEEDRYFEAAQLVYDKFGIGDHISRIEIISGLNIGECLATLENEKLKISIRLSLNLLGVDEHSGCIHPFSQESCKKFTDTLAHELFHAQSIIDLTGRFGLKEYRSILESNNGIAKFGWTIMDEYSVCRLTAEEYHSYDSTEDVKIRMSFFDTLAIEIQYFSKNGGPTPQQRTDLIDRIVAINYALATRCAFADVSGDTEEHLNLLKWNSGYKPYITKARQIFNQYYAMQPLSRAQYKEIGYKLMESMLFFLVSTEIDSVVELLFDE